MVYLFRDASQWPQSLPTRHTALTRLADAGCDAFTLARIAGHSSVTITQRYCHPQNAIERAFARLSDGEALVTDGGQHDNRTDILPEQVTTTVEGRGSVVRGVEVKK